MIITNTSPEPTISLEAAAIGWAEEGAIIVALCKRAKKQVFFLSILQDSRSYLFLTSFSGDIEMMKEIHAHDTLRSGREMITKYLNEISIHYNLHCFSNNIDASKFVAKIYADNEQEK